MKGEVTSFAADLGVCGGICGRARWGKSGEEGWIEKEYPRCSLGYPTP